MLTPHATAVALAVAGSVLLTGCVGQGDDDPVSKGRDATEVMQLAKKTLDETSGVEITLSTASLPDSVSSGITSASGIGVHPPAFQGSLEGRVSGFPGSADVIAVDGDVWTQIQNIDPSYVKRDPADFGAPDPAQLMATEGGLSDLLVETDDLEKGDEVRGGDNNEEVLTEYSGTLPAELVTVLIPAAEGEFDVLWEITSDGELRRAEITGDFYGEGDDLTYELTLDDYGTEKDITAP